VHLAVLGEAEGSPLALGHAGSEFRRAWKAHGVLCAREGVGHRTCEEHGYDDSVSSRPMVTSIAERREKQLSI
jgi:hypothetical protein